MVANLSVDRGTTPHNITLNADEVESLGQGCHSLTVAASNKVTTRTVSADLELCVLEPVEGLQASVITDEDLCSDSTDLVIGVSLGRGDPVELLFTLTGAEDTLSETRDMVNHSVQHYTFSSPLEGT